MGLCTAFRSFGTHMLMIRDNNAFVDFEVQLELERYYYLTLIRIFVGLFYGFKQEYLIEVTGHQVQNLYHQQVDICFAQCIYVRRVNIHVRLYCARLMNGKDFENVFMMMNIFLSPVALLSEASTHPWYCDLFSTLSP